MIFGSTAIKYWFPDYEKEPNDVDIIGKGKSTREVEYHWCDAFNMIPRSETCEYVDPDTLFTIKASHLGWDINWDKHMRDFIFLRDKGCVLNMKLYKALYACWEEIHGKKKAYLKVSNEEFFKDNVKREFNHDYLHERFAYQERPMNEKFRPDLSSPYCSKEMFEALPEHEQLIAALEETHVIAFERYIINGMPPRAARVKAIKNLIQSQTKGWFQLYLIMNFDKVVKDRAIGFEETCRLLKEQSNGTRNDCTGTNETSLQAG